MNILHDWDEVSIRVDWARRKGISLLIYCLANKFSILKNIKWIANNTKNIEYEKLLFMDTLAKLDILIGVKSIFGITDSVNNKYTDDIEVLKNLYNLDIRLHIHDGKPPDPDRSRFWIPPLLKKTFWHFDTDYRKGIRHEVKDNEIAVFHIDYPYHLSSYIDYLYEVMKDER